MSILRQDSVFKTRLQDLKKNSILNSNERQGVNVEDDNDFIHPHNVRLTCVGPVNFLDLRRSIGGGKLSNILESKNKFQQLAVLICFPEMPSKLGQFCSTQSTYLLLNHK